jgi:outer membrane protein assembly factor BamE (lipoprotein component of BamABCDE complex)
MRPKSLHRPGLAAILCGFLAVACAPTVQVHGFVPPQADIARIRPGVDNTAAVQQILGLPSSSGVLRDSAWYYVQSTVENYTYHAPKVVDRTVVAVNFDNRGVVRDVKRYGLADGRVINLETRTTETGGRQLGVIEQLFGNILNLDAEALNNGGVAP